MKESYTLNDIVDVYKQYVEQIKALGYIDINQHVANDRMEMVLSNKASLGIVRVSLFSTNYSYPILESKNVNVFTYELHESLYCSTIKFYWMAESNKYSLNIFDAINNRIIK